MNSLEEAIYTTLTGGTALVAKLGGTAIYNTLAPQETALPYVVFNKGAGTEANSSPRRAQDYVYTVKAVSTTHKEAGEIDDLVDDLMHDGTLTVTGWNDYWCRRESDVAYAEPAGDGKLVWHQGAQYRIRLAE